MRFQTVITTLALAVPALAATELKVEQYDGPTECDDDKKVKAGQYLSMHYTGTIDESSETGEKGSKFDSSRDRGSTFDFQIGVGQVIKGWDEGIVGLCVGAKAKLIIPPEKGYGAQGAGGVIPGGATLNFDVEVVDISEGPPPPPNFFTQIDLNQDGVLDKDEIEKYFKDNGYDVPAELWEREDTNKDGVISWEEFSGPKGDSPPSVKEDL
jgi:FK506-binding protein 14